MTVLTLTGKPINWVKPPKSTTKVLWSMRSIYGHQVTGSLRTIAALDRLNNLAKKKFGRSISVIQTPYNTTIKASSGTHDFDACLDVWINGVDPWVQQDFFRANGAAAYYRYPPSFTRHIHLFILPPRKGDDVSKSWMLRGFKVGYLVDGGWSTRGKKVASSQIADYYDYKDALASHAAGRGWFPPDINATIFDLGAYIAKRAGAPVVGPKPLAAPLPQPTSLVHGLVSLPASLVEKVATNNLMALPKNKHIQATLRATPEASLLIVQEADKFHTAIQHVPGYVTTAMPGGRAYSCFVLWNPAVWDHIETRYPLAYHGHRGVSLTRHLAVTTLRHRATGIVITVISYHSVTAGNDRVRKALRRQGDAVVRREFKAARAGGVPVLVGADMNRLRKAFRTATAWVHHRLDHIYGWSGATASLTISDWHHKNTPSDHDVVVATIISTKK